MAGAMASMVIANAAGFHVAAAIPVRFGLTAAAYVPADVGWAMWRRRRLTSLPSIPGGKARVQ